MGDPACWATAVCPRCGAVDEPGHRCGRPSRALLGVLPAGLEHRRTTDVFDQASVPSGLLRSHRLAPGVWGRLVVHEGAVRFRHEDGGEPLLVSAGDWVVIEPERPHRLELLGPVRLAVEFHAAAG